MSTSLDIGYLQQLLVVVRHVLYRAEIVRKPLCSLFIYITDSYYLSGLTVIWNK